MCVKPAGSGPHIEHVIARWRRHTVSERAPVSFPPSSQFSRLCPPTTSFHFFSSVPASDCRHSWLPSHRLSSCFPLSPPTFRPAALRAISPSSLLTRSPFYSVSRRLSSSIRSRQTHCQSFVGSRYVCFIVVLYLVTFSCVALLMREAVASNFYQRQVSPVRPFSKLDRKRCFCESPSDYCTVMSLSSRDSNVGTYGVPFVFRM